MSRAHLNSHNAHQAAVILYIAGPVLVKIQSAAENGEVNVVRSSLEKTSTAAEDETSSEKVLSARPRHFRPEAPHCTNYTGHESLKDYINKEVNSLFKHNM